MTRKLVIDCDTGVDDALALLLALRSPVLDVVGITTVSGNVPLDKVVRNTLVVVEHACQESVPVTVGAYRPLVKASGTAEYAHGSDGLGDVGFPEPHLSASDEHAADFLVRTFMESQEPVELVTLGPLTNLALALNKERELASRIPSLVMMAGGVNGGNVTSAAEFNIWVDPEAADLVFRSGIPMTMVPLDPLYEGGKIYPEDVSRLEQSEAPWCSMASRLLRSSIARWKAFLGEERPATPPDLLAMAVALDSSLAEATMRHVAVETRGEHTRGMTVVDRRPFARQRGSGTEPNINVVTVVDNARYRKLILETLLAQPNNG